MRSTPNSVHATVLARLGLASTLVFGLASCAAFGRQAQRANEHAKASSRADWSETHIAGVSAEQYLGARTAMLFGGVDSFVVVDKTPGGRTGYACLNGKRARDATGAAAFAVDERGYWLTAAHAVDRAPLLVVQVAGVDVNVCPARVVWSGASSKVDIALIHTAGLAAAPIPWSAKLPFAGRVFCCGSGLGSDRFSGGRITGVSGSTEETTFTAVEHDAPLSAGDSGGPAIAEDGTLVGVNIETASRPFGSGEPDSTAVLPAERFIRELVERDQAALRNGVAPSGAQRP